MNAPACSAALAAPLPLAELVRANTGANVHHCWQCVKCTSGCPLADQFDLTPNQVMRALQLGDARVLASRAIWLCASCHTCATRCPRDIDVTAVMDVLRIEARRRGVKPAVPAIAAFNAIFMRLVGFFGRVPEALLMGVYNLARREPMRDAGLGWKLLRRGRLNLLPKRVKPGKVQEPANAGPKALAYFPGCASEGSAFEYDRTARAAAKALDIELVEPEGWTCCGASPAHATDPVKAAVMPLRTLAMVEQMRLDTLTSPCSACFTRLKSAEHALRAHPDKVATAVEQTGHRFDRNVTVRHLLDAFMERAGAQGIAARVRRPLAGLKVACYYGCLITRPAKLTGAEHHEYPVRMDELVRALGAEPVPWSAKTDCCGGSLGMTQTDIALAMTRRILENARACGADVVATMCPMCHMNLDARQPQMQLDAPVPVVHATQLMVLAFGLGERAACLDRAIVDPRPVLAGKGLLAQAAGR